MYYFVSFCIILYQFIIIDHNLSVHIFPPCDASMRPRPFLQGSFLQSSPEISSSNSGKAAGHIRPASRKCLDFFGLVWTFWSPCFTLFHSSCFTALSKPPACVTSLLMQPHSMWWDWWDWWEDVPHYQALPPHISTPLALELPAPVGFGWQVANENPCHGLPSGIQGTESYRDPCQVHRLHTKEHDNSHTKNGD